MSDGRRREAGPFGSEGRRNRCGDRGEPRACERNAQGASREPEQHHLQDVGRQDLLRRRPDALQDRDALDLLAHEHACDAPHADPAENEYDEADEAQVILGAGQVIANLIFR